MYYMCLRILLLFAFFNYIILLRERSCLCYSFFRNILLQKYGIQRENSAQKIWLFGWWLCDDDEDNPLKFFPIFFCSTVKLTQRIWLALPCRVFTGIVKIVPIVKVASLHLFFSVCSFVVFYIDLVQRHSQRQLDFFFRF